jgi:hypothetical protein
MKVTAVHAQAGPAASQARQGAGQGAAESAARAASNSAQGQASSATARVTTTSFGFSLGKFGLRYTQDEVTLAPDESALRAAQRLAQFRASQKANAFAEDLSAAGEYNTLSETGGTDTVSGAAQGASGSGQAGQGSSASASATATAESPSPAHRKYGLAAYAKATRGAEGVSLGGGLGEV